MTQIIEAIPTTYDGIRFKSRLEARFYEWAKERGFVLEYEPVGFECYNDYIPDFYLKEFRLFIEIKPREFLGELEIFSNSIEGIEFSNSMWICVDKKDRYDWEIIHVNLAFCEDVEFPLPTRFDLSRGESGPLFRIFTDYLDLSSFICH